MNCHDFLDALDRAEGSPYDGPRGAEALSHAEECPSCAAEAASVRAALSLLRLPELACSADLAPRLSALLPFLPAPRRIVSMRDWLAAGLLILAGMVILPLLSSFGILGSQYGTRFTLPLSLVLGLVVSTYGTVFIISHLEDFSRRLNGRHARPAA